MEPKSQVNKMIAEIDCFQKIKHSIEKEYPYRFNPLDAVNIDENAQSRILAELLRYKCRKKDDYLFARELINHLQDNEDFIFSENIKNIEVTVEKYRIDILIRQKKDFAIIVENKLYDAVDQPNQIDRYIDFCRNYLNFKDDSIYVIYLTPNESKIPFSSFSVENQSKFKGRFKSVSVEKDLLPILDKFEETIPKDQNLLNSGVDQYIDYLKYFMDNEKYNSEMNGKIKQELVNHLGLENLNLVEKLEKIGSYNEGIESFMSYMNNMYNDFRKDLIEHWYDQCAEKRLKFKEEYGLELKLNLETERKYVELIPNKNPDNISFRIEDDIGSVYYGIYILGKKEDQIPTKYVKDGFEMDENPKWYAWKYIKDYNEGIDLLTILVEETLSKNSD
ncbi:MAG: hypothetical protein COA32_00815 [Fluviicola sp.]|nr:MAG: hypothetical protein COA32_00815 [Fluviicola sp.]